MRLSIWFFAVPLGSLLYACGLSQDSQDASATQTADTNASVLLAENNSVVSYSFMTADASGTVITYALEATPTTTVDNNLFAFDSSSRALSFASTPDYENPTDANNDNVYLVQFIQTTGSNTARFTLSVEIINTNDIAPTFSPSGVVISLIENQTNVYTISATDADNLGSLSYSFAGTDSAQFAYAANDIVFLTAPNYEQPADIDGDNQYHAELIVSDGTHNATFTLRVDVTNDTQDTLNAPNFSDAATTITVAEGSNFTFAATATDADGGPISFSLAAVDDADDFTFDGTRLSFANISDFESPTDSNRDNQYQAKIVASDGTNRATQTVTVSVTNQPESPTVTLSATQVKRIEASWPTDAAFNHYTLAWQEQIGSGYQTLATTTAGSITINATSLLDFVNATVLLTACVDMPCATKQSTQVTIAASELTGAIGYIKATTPLENEYFGVEVAFSNDGSIMAVGASGGLGTGTLPGHVDIFERTGATWAHLTRIGASNPDAGDAFGISLAMNNDASVIAVNANYEDGDGTGVNPSATNNATDTGAVYVFHRNGNQWQQKAYIKSSVATGRRFGYDLKLSGDGRLLAAPSNASSNSVLLFSYDAQNDIWRSQSEITEQASSRWFGAGIALNDSADRLVIADHLENASTSSGSTYSVVAHLYSRNGTNWSYDDTLTLYTETTNVTYNVNVTINDSGDAFAVGITNESSSTGVVYVYTTDTSGQWSQHSRLTASNANENDNFGTFLVMNNVGDKLLVCSQEGSASPGINGDQSDNSANAAGAAYLFELRNNAWQQTAYIKSPNPQADDFFILCAMSGDGNSIAIGAPFEDGGNGGIAPDFSESATNAGAVYLY